MTTVSPSAAAHPAQFTTLQVQVEADGRFRASLNVDLLAYALFETSTAVDDAALTALLDGPRDVLAGGLAQANGHLRREVVVRTDAGDAPVLAWKLPGVIDVDKALSRNLLPRTVVPGTIEFAGTVPTGAHTLAVRLPYVLGPTLSVISLPDGRTVAEPVAAGDYSPELRLDLSGKPPRRRWRNHPLRTPVTINACRPLTPSRSHPAGPGETPPGEPPPPPTPGPAGAVAPRAARRSA